MHKSLIMTGVAILCIAIAGCVHKSKNIAVSLSGTITAAPGNATDTDTNDLNAPYSSNNTPLEAQTLPNPITVGGFVALAGTVSVGRFADSAQGDQADFYSLTLLEGQAVTLTIGDRFGDNYVYGIGDQYDENDIANKPGNIIDLYLLDSNQSLISSTANNDAAQIKSLTAPSTGVYYVKVVAVTGASDYLLSTGTSCQPGVTVLPTNATLAASNGALNVNDEFVPGEVIVQFKPVTSPAAAYQSASTKAASLGLLAKAGTPERSMLMSLGDPLQSQKALAALNVRVEQTFADAKTQLKYETLQVVKALRARSDVEYAKPNYIRHPAADPNDLYYPQQWNLPLINWPQVWNDNTVDGSGAIVAVIDTGILPDHPDINADRLVAGFDFIRDLENAADGDGIDNDPTDPGVTGIFHGTHVAGIIAAETDNSAGIAGVAWNARIMPLRALGASGGTDYDIEQAVLYAAGLPNDGETAQQTADRVAAGDVADVINLSLGGPTDSTVAPQAYKKAREQGVIVVAAAGNESSCGLSYPASLEGVVSVSAVGPTKVFADYSNFGPTIDVAAPGGTQATGIYSAWADKNNGTLVYDYSTLVGTSMAAPHVAGVVALMKSANPNLTPDGFDSLLVNGELTQDLGVAGRDTSYGYGLIDAQLAVQAANLTTQALNPQLVAMPAALSFEQGTDQLNFSLTNGGGGNVGDLVVDPPVSNNAPWLTIDQSADVDAVTGLGTYVVTVDRNSLPQQPSTGAMIAVSYKATDAQNNVTNGTLNIPVIVYRQNFTADAGYQYVLLYNTATPDWANSPPFRTVGVAMSNGKYQYKFEQIPPGVYAISAGSDLNSNDQVNDKADAKGEYPSLSRSGEVIVNDANIRGLNFNTGYNQ